MRSIYTNDEPGGLRGREQSGAVEKVMTLLGIVGVVIVVGILVIYLLAGE